MVPGVVATAGSLGVEGGLCLIASGGDEARVASKKPGNERGCLALYFQKLAMPSSISSN